MRPLPFLSGYSLLCGVLGAQIATTSALIGVTPASPLFGQVVTLVAQVTPAAPGTVSFMDGGILIGAGTLNGSGAAQVTTITLAAGQHSLRAVYGGSTGYSSSQSAAMPYTVTAVAASGFATPVNYAVTGFPGAIAVNDFNNDGKADVAVSTSGYITILLGNGDGTLQHKADYSASAPSSITVGDFNADGKLDLAFTGYYDVLVMLGNGDGTFQTAVSYSLPGNSTSVAVGDANGDGKADLIVAISGMQPCMGNVCTWIDGGIGVLPGNGDGTFGAVAKTTVAGSPAQVALSDFNGDGKIDIVAANLGGMISINNPRPGSGATVMLGNGDGTFQPAVTYPAGNSPDAVAIGDFNGDGKPDLAIASGGDNAINVLAGNGNGTFQAAVAYAVGNSPNSVVPADINADGKMDLVAAAGNVVAVLFGNGDGTFGGSVGYTAGDYPAFAAVADFNGDNRADLAVRNSSGNYVTITLGIFSSEGSAQPTATSLAASPNPSPYGQAVTLTAQVSPSDATGSVEFLDGVTVLGSAPLNASGIAQFSTTLLASGTRSLRAIYSGVSGAWKSSQSGVVSQVVNQPAASAGFSQMASYITGIYPYSVAAGDFNGDGKPDLAVANLGGQSVSVLPGTGDGTFGSAVTYALPGEAYFVAVADFNGDGKQDLVVACPSYVSILLGDGGGTFQNPVNRFVGGIAALVTGDFNGDGKTDIAFVDEQVSGAMKVMLGNGDGTLQPATSYGAGSSPRSIASGDFNGDGKTDLVVANYQGNTFSVYLGKGDGTFQSAVNYPAGTYPAAVQVGDFNGDGKLDLAVGGYPLEVALGKGDGTFPSLVTYPAVTDVDAIAVADVNGDGKLDLAITRWTGGNGYSLAVMPGKGDGTFQAALNLADGFRSMGILAADFNGDGRTDLAAATFGGNILAVLLGAGNTAPQALRFVPITPCRVNDTRTYYLGQLEGGSSRDFAISGTCGVPATAQAYALNVTAVPAGPLGYLTVWPTGMFQPLASTLNSLDGRVKSSAAIVPAGTQGSISVFASNATDVVLDIDGYFVPATDTNALAFYPVTPCRIADTRKPAADLGGPTLAGGQSRTFPVLSAASCNIPPAAQAYSLNFAAVPQGALGYITAWPTGQSRPVVSTLNAPTGAITANAAIVPAGSGGSIDIFASNTTNLVIDINGYFAPASTGGLSLYSTTPCRVLDTRKVGNGTALSGGTDVDVAGSACGPPSGNSAYVFSATVVPSAALGYLTLWPQDQTRPVVSTLNAMDAAITSNLAIVPSANGSISAFTSDPTHLILDISGYFAQ